MSNSTKTQVKSYTLAQLKEFMEGPVVVMICRTWDVHNINGRYLSTDFVVSVEKVKLKYLLCISLHVLICISWYTDVG